MASQLRLRGPVYSTKWWSTMGRRGKWMLAIEGDTAFEASRSIEGILGNNKRAQLIVMFTGPKSPEDATNVLHVLVVREYERDGSVLFENEPEYKKYLELVKETTPAAK